MCRRSNPGYSSGPGQETSFVLCDITEYKKYGVFNIWPMGRKCHRDLISTHLTGNGTLYIGELHPFKQYSGSKASYETENGKQPVTCFTHHIPEFTSLAKKNGLTIKEVKEYFDEGNTTSIPRILTLRFVK